MNCRGQIPCRIAEHLSFLTPVSHMRGWISPGMAWWGAVVAILMAGGVNPSEVSAQQRIGYVDTEYILDQMPEYTSVQQKLDQLEERWREEIESQKEEVDTLRDEFQAREVLYTDEERKRKRQEIQEAQKEIEKLRQQYFGPEGQLYTRQKELMRPIQERVLTAVEDVATEAGYDYVLDKKGETLFMFARDEHSLSDQVLQELGINVDETEGEE